LTDLNRIHDVEAQGLSPNPVHFYDFLQNRVMIIFKPKFDDADAESEFSLVLSKKQNYDMVYINLHGHRKNMSNSVFRCQTKLENTFDMIPSSYDSQRPTPPLANRNLFLEGHLTRA